MPQQKRGDAPQQEMCAMTSMFRIMMLAATLAFAAPAVALEPITVRPLCDKPLPSEKVKVAPTTRIVLVPADAFELPKPDVRPFFRIEVVAPVSTARRDIDNWIRAVEKCMYIPGANGPTPYEVTKITVSARMEEVDGESYWVVPLPTALDAKGVKNDSLEVRTGFRASPGAPLVHYNNYGKWRLHELDGKKLKSAVLKKMPN